MNSKLVHIKPDFNKLPGGWEPPYSISLSNDSDIETKEIINCSAFLLENVFSKDDCLKLIQFMKSADLEVPVTVQGRKDIPDDRIGSVRVTAWCEDLANQIWVKIGNFIPIRSMNDNTSTDWWQEGKHKNWKPTGVSPLLRFMRYEKAGLHYAHYDAGFIYPDGIHRTLMSMVIYLTSNNYGGSTRLINDGQENLPVWERNHDDWTRPVDTKEVIASISPKQGRVFIFDHRICHDVEEHKGDESRIIIRGDIIFKKIP